MSENIQHFIDRAPSVRVLVIGDCMLDTYITGSASRISPEAPVPVVNVSRRRHLPGGAANVAANARSLGASVILAGVTGTDISNSQLREVLSNLGIEDAALVADPAGVTTTKTRVTAAGQQIVRFDDEAVSHLPAHIAVELQSSIMAALDDATVIVISDYMKGVVTRELCEWLIPMATLLGKPLVVDPKGLDFTRYRGATVITPNLKETAAAAHARISNHVDLEKAAGKLLSSINPSSLLVTRGEDGMTLFEPGLPERHLPAIVNEVADVTGAGDTVVAALAIALGVDFDLPDAAAIANVAAGVAVSHHGTWAVKAEELLALIPKERNSPAAIGS